MRAYERTYYITCYLALVALFAIVLACASTRQQAGDSSLHQALEYKLSNSLFKAQCQNIIGVPAKLVASCQQSKVKLVEVYTALHNYGNELAACSAAKKSCNAQKKAYLQNEEHYTKLMGEIQEALDP